MANTQFTLDDKESAATAETLLCVCSWVPNNVEFCGNWWSAVHDFLYKLDANHSALTSVAPTFSQQYARSLQTNSWLCFIRLPRRQWILSKHSPTLRHSRPNLQHKGPRFVARLRYVQSYGAVGLVVSCHFHLFSSVCSLFFVFFFQIFKFFQLLVVGPLVKISQ